MSVGGALQSKSAVVTIMSASTDERFLGTFALWWAWDPTWRWWQNDLLAEAEAAVQQDCTLLGKRQHNEDSSGTCYSFSEWADFIDAQGWGGPSISGAVVLAMFYWKNKGLPEEDKPWLQISPAHADVQAGVDTDDWLNANSSQADVEMNSS